MNSNYFIYSIYKYRQVKSDNYLHLFVSYTWIREETNYFSEINPSSNFPLTKYKGPII